ncbi:MAG: baseplate J/gp47 family protein [Acidiphilium sp.]
MTWPVPAPGVIAARGAALFEQAIPGIDARSDNTVATTLTRVAEMGATDLYFQQAYYAQQLMVDTATDWLPVHGAMWGVPQVQPSAAGGNVLVTGTPGATIPAGVEFGAASQAIYTSTAAVVLSSAGAGSLPVSANVAGSSGNLGAGATLTAVSPVADLAPQTGVVDANGITGGLDIESLDSWRARILQKIRTEPSGGNYDDYVEWAMQAIPGVAYAACPPGACGGGVVSVVFAMAGPTAPTAEEVAAVQAYIETLRPVTASVTVYGATLNPVPVSLQVRPNTVDVEAAAQQALALFFALGTIGGTTYASALDAALATTDGETYHERLAPAADVPAPSLFAINTLGAVTFS